MKSLGEYNLVWERWTWKMMCKYKICIWNAKANNISTVFWLKFKIAEIPQHFNWISDAIWNYLFFAAWVIRLANNFLYWSLFEKSLNSWLGSRLAWRFSQNQLALAADPLPDSCKLSIAEKKLVKLEKMNVFEDWSIKSNVARLWKSCIRFIHIYLSQPVSRLRLIYKIIHCRQSH